LIPDFLGVRFSGCVGSGLGARRGHGIPQVGDVLLEGQSLLARREEQDGAFWPGVPDFAMRTNSST
jgi:hypothetical protein